MRNLIIPFQTKSTKFFSYLRSFWLISSTHKSLLFILLSEDSYSNYDTNKPSSLHVYFLFPFHNKPRLHIAPTLHLSRLQIITEITIYFTYSIKIHASAAMITKTHFTINITYKKSFKWNAKTQSQVTRNNVLIHLQCIVANLKCSKLRKQSIDQFNNLLFERAQGDLCLLQSLKQLLDTINIHKSQITINTQFG